MPTLTNEYNISRPVLFKKLGYNPHSQGQWRAHNSTARFRIPCCGRRWGKSQWAGHELTAKMFRPSSINWIVAPKYVLGEKEFRVVWSDFKKLGLLSRCKKHFNVEQGRMDIYFPDLDSTLVVKSAERPDTLVGEGIHHVCMSEAAKHKRSTWEMYIRPALQDYRGTADFPSTPQGFNWYKGLFDIGQLPDYPDYESWTYPSWTNPIIFPGGRDDPEILELERNVSLMFFEQEIAALFTSMEGSIYPDFDPTIHVGKVDYDPRNENWMALDFGFTDPFVCLDVMVDPSDRVKVWREYQVSYKSTGEHGLILKNRDNPDGYHVNGIAADPRGADEIATLAWILGGMQAHDVGRELGYEEIRRALKVREDGTTGLMIDESCTDLRRQMQNLRTKNQREGKNAPEGQHDYDDHGPDALRYFFNERFVLGAGASLKDLYDASYAGSEAEGYFKYETGIKLNDEIWGH